MTTRINKHPELIVRKEDPFNAGMPLPLLTESHLTPNDRFFVRNHAPVPEIDEAAFRLSVGGLTGKRLEISLDEMRNIFPKSTVMASLQCAGNRRDELIEIAPIDDQISWGEEAIGNAEWGGVPLREVLSAAEVEAGGHHVAFTGLDEVAEYGEPFGFGGSIPIDKAMSDEVLLAYEMNGQPLPPEHGAPLRVVVPGYIGARSVKWVSDISVQREPSDNHYQARAYKIFLPHVRSDTADWSKGLMLGELSVNSAITSPANGETVSGGPVVARGWAMAGGDRRIERVDVSLDGGETWAAADLLDESHRWSWRLWEIPLDLAPGEHEIAVRAWDSAANTQPEDVRKLWNFKGYMNNAWHSISVRVEG
jgi:sulfite oxidase